VGRGRVLGLGRGDGDGGRDKRGRGRAAMKGSVWERRIILVESEEEMMGSAGVRRDGRQASRQAGRRWSVSQSVSQ
jgi:hypothetical protein